MHSFSKDRRREIEYKYKQKVIDEKRYYCPDHDIAYTCITHLNKHLQGMKHNPKLYVSYYCNYCDYHTKYKYSYKLHLKTMKHQQTVT